MTLNSAQQNYLKVIYRLTRDGERASTTQLAALLDVQAASVTNMLQKLAATSPPLVAYRKHRGATLTPAGQQAALAAIRQHRLIETFLYEKLDYPWEDLHAEAAQLEQAVTTQVSERMAVLLDQPETTPHGQPIPAADLTLTAPAARPLTTLRPGETAVIAHCRDEDPALLRFLANHNLRPGTAVTLHQHTPDGNLVLAPPDGEMPVEIRPSMAAQIFITT